jgi:diguanylate cyclase (GGDEF)-like protein
VLSDNDGATKELQNAADALQADVDQLLRDVRDRSTSSSRRAISQALHDYRSTASSLVQSVDERHALLLEYSAHYDAMHSRARAAIDSAWKVFGRVVARQALVTLNRQIEDFGRNSAELRTENGDPQAITALLASNESAVAATLRDNDRSLSSSQGKAWVTAMNTDLQALSILREKFIALQTTQQGLRTQFGAARNVLESRSRAIVIVRTAPTVKPSVAVAGTADVVSARASSRGHHSPRFGRNSSVTTIDHDTRRSTLLAWISAGVLLLVVAICIVTVRSVVGPVRRLVRATTRLAEGDLNARVATSGIKELATLAGSFNDMAARLAQAERITRNYQTELEAEVANRTEQLKRLASSDTLTSLPNRRELFVLLHAALQRAAIDKRRVGVFFMDLDNFKNINDGMGHAFGDQVLKAMAARLESTVAEFGFAARLGGDEFTVVMTSASSMAHIEAAGLRLVDAFDDPLQVGGRDLILSVSVGASVFPDHERDADALLRAADAALFRAKALGRSQLTMYSPELLATAETKFTIEQGLRTALEKGQFELVFQPELNLATMQVELVEALIRWRQDDGRLATPGEFLAVAEESGLIMEISDWVLRSAISTAAQWHHGSWPDARVAINVSSRQLIDATFVDRVRNLLQQYRLPPRCIEIELTESVLQTGPVTLEALRQLRALGIAIALDDFGTGYSSLTSLQQLPLSRIKLDRSLVDDIDSSPRTLAITRSIISLSRSLGLIITAEGIERAEQLAILLEEGDMFVQGYLLSRPVREPEVIATLASIGKRCEALLLPTPTLRMSGQSVVANVDPTDADRQSASGH